MTQTEYENKKRECWEEYWKPRKAYRRGDAAEMVHYDAFSYAFDRAYELGKQETKQEIKQETDADTVIQGWVCRDNNSLNAQVLIGDKPKRTGFNCWENKSADCITLPKDLFPDLTWESEPEEVEIIIKRKKK